jgi:small GTP-binding protein
LNCATHGLSNNLFFSKNMDIPISNVNLCLVGGVSTGKSTVLNAFFLQKLSPSSKQRTTMVPTVYVESAGKRDVDVDAIYTAVEEKNRDLLDKSSKGVAPQTADYAEMVFAVGPLDLNLQCRVNIYDIPGLNDARTKNLYYDYLRANFAKFNVVILLVDVQSGINTSDEMDILKFVVAETVRHRASRNIRTLVIANKCDDMQWDEKAKTTTMEGELETMFGQVVATVRDTFREAGIEDHLIGVQPLCALDAYLYRMIRKHGAAFKLSPEQFLKIGVNECGKKFSKYPRARQEKEVKEIVQKESFLDDMITLSGFAGVQRMLQDHLTSSYKQDQIANILATLNSFNVDAEIAPFVGRAPGLFCTVPDGFPWTAVRAHLAAYAKLDAVDESVYQEKVRQLFEKLRSHVYVPGMVGPRHPIVAFDKFRTFAVEHFPMEVPGTGSYPPFICEAVEAQLAAVPRIGLGQLDFFPVMKEMERLTAACVSAYVQERFLSNSVFSLAYVDYQCPGFNTPAWTQEVIDRVVATLVEIENVLGPSDLTVEVARHFWATYNVHTRRDAEEQFKRRVLHLSQSDDLQTVAILFQDGIPCRNATTLTQTVKVKELRSDGRFKLDFYLFDLLHRNMNPDEDYDTGEE